MTTLDGYQMALKGRAGPALSIAAVGSFVAGTFSVVLLTLLAPPLADAALSFGPPEYLMLMLLGLATLSVLLAENRLKGILSALFGLMLGLVGLDVISALPRFTFGELELLDGIGFLGVAVGLFGIGEVLHSLERVYKMDPIRTKLRDLLLRKEDIRDSSGPIARGTVLGFVVGVLPGAGATIASFLSYALEKRISRHPEKFGTGTIEGVAAPEAANNASTGGAMVPLLTLGIPGSGTTAVMLGAIMLFGLRPGPLLFENNPDFVWGVIASMYVGNVMLVILNILFVPLFVRALMIPYTVLAALIVLFCIVGVYSLNFSIFELWIMLLFGIIGYLMRKLEFPSAPIVLAMVLGPMMETNLRQSLLLSQGSFAIFFTRPISAVLAVLVIVFLLLPVLLGLVAKKPLPAAEEV
jgi:putative tricarboxylic transport membrane protein